jgi:hypothetical protein
MSELANHTARVAGNGGHADGDALLHRPINDIPLALTQRFRRAGSGLAGQALQRALLAYFKKRGT